MSDRILTFRPVCVGLLALSLSAAVMAQTAPAAQADAAKAPPKAMAAATDKDPDLALAKKAALDWLVLSDAGKFDATWEQAATSFKKAQTKADWARGLGGARPTMGKLITRTFLNSEVRMNLPNLPPGKYITVRFNSVFEKHKDGAESVTLIKDGTRGFRMMSYFLK
ncbi:MAG: DUF4019 domain-containing protein [Vicinamibacteria bacterium]